MGALGWRDALLNAADWPDFQRVASDVECTIGLHSFRAPTSCLSRKGWCSPPSETLFPEAGENCQPVPSRGGRSRKFPTESIWIPHLFPVSCHLPNLSRNRHIDLYRHGNSQRTGLQTDLAENNDVNYVSIAGVVVWKLQCNSRANAMFVFANRGST